MSTSLLKKLDDDDDDDDDDLLFSGKNADYQELLDNCKVIIRLSFSAKLYLFIFYVL